MNRSMSKVAALAAVTALALTGCGRDESTSEAGAPEAEPVSDGPATGTIDVWAMGAEGEALGEFAKGFMEENPDAEVRVTAVPWGAAHDKISTAIAAGETPDVSLIGTTWMGEFAAAGGLDPTPTELIDSSSFFDAAWDSTVVDGVSYGVPWYVDTRVLYYRTDLAAEAGFTEAPKTWDELTEMTSAIQDNGAEYGISLQPGGTGSWQTVLPFAWQNGADIYDGNEFTFDTQEMVGGLEYYQSFFKKGISPLPGFEPGELESAFVNGRVGAFISGPWHIDLLEQQGGENFSDKYAVAPLPKGKQKAAFVGGGNLGVFSSADNRDAAWKFVQWLSDPEVQSQWYAETGGLPSVEEAWDSGKLAEDEQLAVFGKQLSYGISPPAVPSWEEIASVVDSEVEKVTVGDKSPADGISSIQRQAEQIGTGL